MKAVYGLYADGDAAQQAIFNMTYGMQRLMAPVIAQAVLED